MTTGTQKSHCVSKTETYLHFNLVREFSMHLLNYLIRIFLYLKKIYTIEVSTSQVKRSAPQNKLAETSFLQL